MRSFKSHKKGQPCGCPFLWLPAHRMLPKEEEKRKASVLLFLAAHQNAFPLKHTARRPLASPKDKNLTRTGQAQHFSRGPSVLAALPRAASRHPPKRIWEGWGEFEGEGDLLCAGHRSPSPLKHIHPADYPRASSAHRARRAASCSAFLQLLPLAVNCCPEGRETCTVKCRACSGPSQARVV